MNDSRIKLNWYDHKGAQQKRYFNILKIVTIVAAATIPFLTTVPMEAKLSQTITAALGAAIVVIEGIQQLYQLQTNWILYRSTSESLRHEKFLFLGHAGPYAVAQDAHSLLAERIESLVSQEHAKWASGQQMPPQGAPSDSLART
ncbi:MAG TPA: DUF4231 domain-containing protein [Candidatus Binataceae bacterium]